MGGRIKYGSEEERREAIRASKRRYNTSKKGKQSMKNWYDKNKDDPAFKEKRNNLQQSTRKGMSVERKEEYKEKDRNHSKSRRRKNPVKHMLYDARKRAKAKGLPFNITEKDIFIPEICPVLGIPLFIGESGRSPHSPSLDRINNLLGYTKDNVAVISLRANVLKNDASIEELKAIVKYMEDNT